LTNTTTSSPSTQPSSIAASKNIKTSAPTTTGNSSVSFLKSEPVQSSKYGLSLLGNPAGNSNQIYLTLNSGISIDFPDQATMVNFLKAKF
jgi:hypothetical protein